MCCTIHKSAHRHYFHNNYRHPIYLIDSVGKIMALLWTWAFTQSLNIFFLTAAWVSWYENRIEIQYLTGPLGETNVLSSKISGKHTEFRLQSPCLECHPPLTSSVIIRNCPNPQTQSSAARQWGMGEIYPHWMSRTWNVTFPGRCLDHHSGLGSNTFTTNLFVFRLLQNYLITSLT